MTEAQMCREVVNMALQIVSNGRNGGETEGL
jgi:hypothetical protein